MNTTDGTYFCSFDTVHTIELQMIRMNSCRFRTRAMPLECASIFPDRPHQESRSDHGSANANLEEEEEEEVMTNIFKRLKENLAEWNFLAIAIEKDHELLSNAFEMNSKNIRFVIYTSVNAATNGWHKNSRWSMMLTNSYRNFIQITQQLLLQLSKFLRS